MSKLTFVKGFNSISEAGLAKNVLAEKGIIAIIKKRGFEFPGGYFGDSSGADLFVSEKRFPEAAELLSVGKD